jgi:TP901 family phage tail tape measure protein
MAREKFELINSVVWQNDEASFKSFREKTVARMKELGYKINFLKGSDDRKWGLYSSGPKASLDYAISDYKRISREVSSEMGIVSTATKKSTSIIDKYQQAIRLASDAESKASNKRKNSLGEVALWAAGWQIAYGTINLVKQSIVGTIKDFSDLEMALIRIRQASGESTYSMRQFADGAFNVARATGTSVVEVAQASKTWAQQGKSVSESLKLTETAAMGVNLTGQEMSIVISNLTGMMNAWGMSAEEVAYAQDKLAKVADAEAVEVKDLEDAFLRVGLTAKSVGITFEELAAMVTSVGTITRRTGGEIGDAFKTIFTRYQRAITREDIQNIAKVPVYIDAIGNATMQNTGKMRDFSDVMMDISKVYNSLSETGQGDLMEALAGQRRTEMGRAMFQGIDIYIRTLDEQLGALGYTVKKNSEIMGSFDKQIITLKTAFQELGNAIAQAGLISGLSKIIKLLTNFADGVTAVTKDSFASKIMLISLTAAVGALGIALITASLEAEKANTVIKILGVTSKNVTNALNGLKAVLLWIGKNPIALALILAGGALVKWSEYLLKAAEDTYKFRAEMDKARKSSLMLFKEMIQNSDKISDDKLIEKRAKAYEYFNKLMSEGNTKGAAETARRIKLMDDEIKRRSEGNKLEKDELLVRKETLSQIEHSSKMQEIMGRNIIAIKVEELQKLQQLGDEYLSNEDKLKRQQEIIQEYTSYVYGLKDAFQDAFTDGLDDLITGTGTLNDMLTNFANIIRKDILKQAVDTMMRGMFLDLSEAVRSPFAKAHLAGIDAGKDIIRQAHIDGIVQGFLEAKKDPKTGVTVSVLEGAESSVTGNTVQDYYSKLEAELTKIKEENKAISGEKYTPTSTQDYYKSIEDELNAVRETNASIIGTKYTPTSTQDYYKSVEDEIKELRETNATLKSIDDNTVQLPDLASALTSTLSVAKSASAGDASGAVQSGGGAFLNNLFSGQTDSEIRAEGVKQGLSGEKLNAYVSQKKGNSLSGGQVMAGVMTGYSAYANAKQSGGSQAGAIVGGVMQGVGAMAMMSGNPYAMIGGAVLYIVGTLVSSMGKKSKTTTEVREQTNQITTRINVTNKELEIVNRNLVALRHSFEGFVLQESYYLRSRSRGGVNAQVTSEFALGTRRGYNS